MEVKNEKNCNCYYSRIGISFNALRMQVKCRYNKSDRLNKPRYSVPRTERKNISLSKNFGHSKTKHESGNESGCKHKVKLSKKPPEYKNSRCILGYTGY